jgi:hypothetical protein
LTQKAARGQRAWKATLRRGLTRPRALVRLSLSISPKVPSIPLLEFICEIYFIIIIKFNILARNADGEAELNNEAAIAQEEDPTKTGEISIRRSRYDAPSTNLDFNLSKNKSISI